MWDTSSDLFEKFSKFGVLSRNRIKNNLKELAPLVRRGLLKKIYKKRRVFYELTEQTLSLLNHIRLKIVEEIKLRIALYPQRKHFYEALLQDLRFLDSSQKEAADFLFLGDWRLNSPPTKSQLQLSQLRFYQKEGVL